MGGCLSYDKAHETLRRSVLGTLVKSDKDFDDFFRICKTEVHAISSLIHVNNNQAFYVVVSGEVLVTLRGADDKSVLLNTFQPGDVISFFRAGTILAGSLVSHDLKLSLSFRSTDGIAIVIGADYDAIDYYIERRPHLHGLRAFSELNWTEFRHLPAFASLSVQQLNLLGPLIKLQATKPTEILTVATKTEVSTAHEEYSETVSIKSNGEKHPPQVGIVLTGRCLVVPQWLNLFDVLKELGTGCALVDAAKADSGRTRSVWNKILETVSLPASEKYATLDDDELATEFFNALSLDLKRETTQIYPGSIFGFENYFSRHGTIALDSILSLENGLVGYIDCETLKQLFRMDRRFKKIMQRNFFRSLLDIVKSVVPMLSDMDEKKYSTFSCMVSLRCYQKDEVIFSRGSESYYSYLVLRGSVVEESDDSSRKLEFGSMFGEVSLITGTPYFTTTFAAEPTALICIDKFAFDRVYYNDKEKLAELRIRLLGKDVELLYILAHKKSNEAFADFLKRQMAVENIHFLNSVSKFDEILAQIKKEVWKVLGREAHRFFKVVARNNYTFFDDLFASLSKSRDGVNPVSSQPSLAVIPTSPPSEPLSPVGKPAADELPSAQPYASFSTSATTGTPVESERDGGTPSTQPLRERGGGMKGLLRRSFGNTRAESFKQINEEMTRITDVIKQGIDAGEVQRGSGTTSHVASHNSSRAGSFNDEEVKKGDDVNAFATQSPPPHRVVEEVDEMSGEFSTEPWATDHVSVNTNSTHALPSHGPPIAQAPLRVDSPLPEEMDEQVNGSGAGKPLLRIDTGERKAMKSADVIPIRAPSVLSPHADEVVSRRGGRSGSEPYLLSPLRDKPDRDIATLFQNYNQKFAQNVLELREVARTIFERHIVLDCAEEINIPQKMRNEALERFASMMRSSVGRCLHELYDVTYQQQVVARNRSLQRVGSLLNEESQGLIEPHVNRADVCVDERRGSSGAASIASTLAGGARGSGSGSGNAGPAATSVRDLVGQPLIVVHGGEDSFRQFNNSNSMNPTHSHSLYNTPSHSRRIAASNASNSADDAEEDNEALQCHFTCLFEPMQHEIYQLLNKDAFQRWKQSSDFAALVASLAPYDPRERGLPSPTSLSNALAVGVAVEGERIRGKVGFAPSPISSDSPMPSDHISNDLNPLPHRRPSHFNRNSSRLSLYVTSRSTTSSNTHNSKEKDKEEQKSLFFKTARPWRTNTVAADG